MKGARTQLSFLAQGVDQIGYVVQDIDKTAEHYWKRLGVGPWHFYTYRKPLVRYMTRYGKPADYAMRIAHSLLGPTRIELIQQIAGDTVYSDFIREHGYGVHHLGVLVTDMGAAIREAEGAGYHVTMEGAGYGADGDGRYAYLDTETELGTTLELREPPKSRIPPEKVYPSPGHGATTDSFPP